MARQDEKLAQAVKPRSRAASIVGLMDYNLIRLHDSEPIDLLEAHVLARAYVALWRALYVCEPSGEHSIESLGLAIDFGSQPVRRQ